jgi:hypothetical protein
MSNQNTVTGKVVSSISVVSKSVPPVKKASRVTVIVNPASTVASSTSFGASADVGTSTSYAREDHTHGTPTDPVPEHALLDTGIHGVGDSTVDSVEARDEELEELALIQEEHNIQDMLAHERHSSGIRGYENR